MGNARLGIGYSFDRRHGPSLAEVVAAAELAAGA